MHRRTRSELEAENLVLLGELEAIRNRLDEFLEFDTPEPIQARERGEGDEEHPCPSSPSGSQ